ncbi:GspS/AspS pilotin family protein [Vibrio quintilis]|uniref:Type II secretion system pilot lipoprotein GspS-beta n=1 Tax=Vibrio quintilis TaxID=1117707 RepID=A0A1M7YXP9_9VIBR|nr:GspS/AspS pilotin family protein [Vibrio quintilis]SHO57246.1 hypothetical protein VQ7734_03015 [Vibrio quintilis]
MNKLLIALGLTTVLFGCSSSHSDQDEQLTLLAANRANIIQSKLPVKSGPLSIMRASSNGKIIELMMIYNETAPGAKPIQVILNHSIKQYCLQADTKANLDAGINYRIKMRNSRGQLMIDQLLTKATCKKSS